MFLLDSNHKVIPASEIAKANSLAISLSQAVVAIVQADKDLIEARKTIPSYTAQWESLDYVGKELKTYYDAADKLLELLSTK